MVIVIPFFNASFIYQNNYLLDRSPGYGSSLERRVEAVEEILKTAGDRSYNLVFKGPGSEFESSLMNYEYLAWWLERNPPSKEEQDLVFTIEEDMGRINVTIK